jgi:ornithine cyclodeaminase/alanine dehydrogenase-like protein (mu-crystallin family)
MPYTAARRRRWSLRFPSDRESERASQPLAPRLDEPAHGAYQLSYEAVARSLRTVGLRRFVGRLVTELESTYADPALRTIRRDGYKSKVDRYIDTLEYMSSRSHDYSATKVISSNPSVAAREVPVVTGTMVCTDNDPAYIDQATLLCDASLLTALRTATTTALVAKHVRPNVKRLAIIGSGLEGVTHGFTLAALLPDVEMVTLLDANHARATTAAQELREQLEEEAVLTKRGILIDVANDQGDDRVLDAEAIVTATYASGVVLDREGLRPDVFIAAVGADLEGKRELGDDIYRDARFIADDLRQCLTEGELQYAADIVKVKASEVASLDGYSGSLAAGRIVGVPELFRLTGITSEMEGSLVVYDSTGFSGQDLAVARVLLSLLAETETPRAWNPPTWMSMRQLYLAGPQT